MENTFSQSRIGKRRAGYTTNGFRETHLNSAPGPIEALTLTPPEYTVKWRIAMVLSPKLLNIFVI
jgi:hypothetical protein